MTAFGGIVLFGVKSPLVVDYEETLLRAGLALLAGISVDGPSRLLARRKRVPIAECADRFDGAAFLPCAFAAQNRAELCAQAQAMGLVLHGALIDPHAVVAASTKVGAGSYVNAGVVIGGATIIGDCVLINRAASVGHHCVLDDFCSIGPGATVASNVRMGQGASIGAGATVLPDVRIGEGAVVAAGSVVRRDVAAGTLVSGNPARLSRLRPGRSQIVRNDQE